MLESVLEALASEERDVRLDAYLTLLRTLGAHKNVPDAEVLRPKATQLIRCILRDVSTVNAATNAPDSQITGEACKLLIAMTRMPAVADAMSDDMCSAILRKSITSIEDVNTSKAMVRHYLFLLAEQKFSTQVMTNDCVSRILDALRTIDERYPGNTVVAMRLLVFKRLAEQSPDYMTVRMTTWLEPIFHGMLSSFDDVRSRAVDAGTTLALATGRNGDTSKPLMALFKQEGEDGLTYGEYVASRLRSMLNIKSKIGEKVDMEKLHQSRHVPQIWAVAILFFRSRKDKITTWSQFKLWLNIISQCFNSNDIQTKFHASVAWNRLIYVLMPSASTDEKMYNMLRSPMIAQLGTKGHEKYAVGVRRYALGSYCNLLYYLFRPTASPEDWTRAWNEHVSPLIELLNKRSDYDIACNVLSTLMTSGTQKVWNENRANEKNFVLGTRDLPQLDSRWVRRNIAQVLRVFGPLLQSGLDADSEADDAQKAWSAMLSAVAEAGSKEITASKELKEAIAKLLGFMCTSWPAELTASETAYHLRLMTALVETLGPVHFCEVVLRRCPTNQADVIFEVVNTSPSHRKQGSTDTAIGHLIRFLCVRRGDKEVDMLCIEAATNLIEACRATGIGKVQTLEVLATFVGSLKAQDEVEESGNSEDEGTDTAELPFAARMTSKSPLPRRISAAPSPLHNARRSKSPFFTIPAQPSRRATPKKLRHEDSQIEFAPIHSSPPDVDAAAESQHLTDHQKEVSERQHEHAAHVFSDISASSPAQVLRGPSINVNRLPPRPSSASRMQDKLRSTASEGNEDAERPSTPPLLGPVMGMSDDLPPSSPAQSASERRSNASQRSDPPPDKHYHQETIEPDIAFFDIPSSPPGDDDEGVAKGRQDPLPAVQPAVIDNMEGTNINEDAMPETATEIADEIIERNTSPKPDEGSTNDAVTDAQEKEAAVLHSPKLDNRNALNHEASATEPVAAECVASGDNTDEVPIAAQLDDNSASHDSYLSDIASSDDPTLSAAQLDAEYRQYVDQQQTTDQPPDLKVHSPVQENRRASLEREETAVDIPATSSGSQVAPDKLVKPDSGSQMILDSFVAPMELFTASEPTTDKHNLRRSESVAIKTSPSSSQNGIKRKRGRPAAVARLSQSDSIVSVGSTSSSPSSRAQGAWKFYSNDEPDVEDHVYVTTPSSKRPRKRPTASQVRVIPSRLLDNNDDLSSTGMRKLTRSGSALSDISSAKSPVNDRGGQGKMRGRRQSSKLSQSSDVAEEEAQEEPDQGEAEEPSQVDEGEESLPKPTDLPQTKPSERVNCNSDKPQSPIDTQHHDETPTRKRKRHEGNDVPTLAPPVELSRQVVGDEAQTPLLPPPQIGTPSTTPQTNRRSLLSPSSILQGLRGILQGCRDAVLGSQEEREVDDVLFEIRREVHEAGRRAKKRRVV